MKKNIIAIILAVLMLVSAAANVFADEIIPEDYLVYTIDGMQRVRVTSSYCPTFGDDADTSLVVDHRTGTGLTFDFTGKEDAEKTVSIILASRDAEPIEKAALLVYHDVETIVELELYATNDPEQATWTRITTSNESEDGDWKIIKIEGAEEGFAFYRFDFIIDQGEKFDVNEFALFRTAEKAEQTVDKSKLPLFEREPWRKAAALSKGLRRF